MIPENVAVDRRGGEAPQQPRQLDARHSISWMAATRLSGCNDNPGARVRVVDEDAPLMLRAAEPLGAAVRATVEGERLAMTADGMTGVVLRYGQLYGVP